MEIRRTDKTWSHVEADWLVVPVIESADLTGPWLQLDEALSGLISRLKSIGDLTGKLASLVPLRGVTGIGSSRILFVGLGPAKDLTTARVDKAMVTAARAISDKQETRVSFAIPEETVGTVSPSQFATSAAIGSIVGSLGQDLFKTERARYPFASVQIATSKAELEEAIDRGCILGQAINLTRDLVNRPPQEITPLGFAKRAEAVASVAAAIARAALVLRGLELLELAEGVEWQLISAEGAWEPLRCSWITAVPPLD